MIARCSDSCDNQAPVRLRSELCLASLLAVACVATEPDPAAGSTGMVDTTAVATTAPMETSSGGDVPQSPLCAAWLTCLADVAPAELDAAAVQYGPDGTCWSDADLAMQCEAACDDELAKRCGAGSSGDSGDPPLKCSIEGLVPGASNPIDAGDGVGQIPTAIGDVLSRNCGCHYLDAAELDRTVPAYLGMIALTTLADFHAPFQGAPTYQRVHQRAIVEVNMPPVFYCDSLAVGSLSLEDRAALEAWLLAEAPDGASWR